MSRRRGSEGQCEALFRDGTRCPHAAKHTHHVKPVAIDDLPIVVRVCGIHRRTLERRELGSEASLLDSWLRA
jgi:hypothetical protein